MQSTIGGRLKAVEQYLDGDDEFLATYGDGLTDAPLDEMIDAFETSGRLVQFLSVRPQFNAHASSPTSTGSSSRCAMSDSDVRINGGFFVCRRELLDWIEPGDELVEETFERLIPRGEVVAYPYEGFFGPMDTIKDRQRLEALHESGGAPWRRVGRPSASRGRPDAPVSSSAAATAAPARARDRLPCGRHRDRLRRDAARAHPREPGPRGDWVVLGATASARREARASAEDVPRGRGSTPRSSSTGSGTLPSVPRRGQGGVRGAEAVEPDLVLTHTRDDLHQDHRLACELTWNTFRDHLILEYEIPKWDGDLGRRTSYVPLEADDVEEQARRSSRHFPTPGRKHWFDPRCSTGLMRLRGLECARRAATPRRSYGRKLALAPEG